MRNYIISIDDTRWREFIRFGTLFVKHVYRDISFEKNDTIFVHNSSDGNLYGPFYVEYPLPERYYGRDNLLQIICKIGKDPPGRVSYNMENKFEQIDNDAADKLLLEIKAAYVETSQSSEFVSGVGEIDGLLAAGDIVHRSGNIIVRFVSDSVPFKSYYMDKLKDNGFEARFDRNDDILITDPRLKSAYDKVMIEDHIRNKEFLVGFLGPQIFVQRGRPTSKTPEEYSVSLYVSEIFGELGIADEFLGCPFIIASISGQRYSISPLSAREYPFSLLTDKETNEEEEQGQSIISMDECRLIATAEVIKKIFSFCEYDVSATNKIDDTIFFFDISKNDILTRIFIPASSDWASIVPALDDPVAYQKLAVIASDSDVKIVDCAMLMRYATNDNIGDGSKIPEQSLFNLEKNPFVDLHSSLVLELNFKIFLLWSV